MSALLATLALMCGILALVCLGLAFSAGADAIEEGDGAALAGCVAMFLLFGVSTFGCLALWPG